MRPKKIKAWRTSDKEIFFNYSEAAGHERAIQRNKKAIAARHRKNKRALDKARKHFPVGTEFSSIFGAHAIVASDKGYGSTHFLDSSGCVMVNTKNRGALMVYDGKRWAQKIKKGRFVEVK